MYRFSSKYILFQNVVDRLIRCTTGEDAQEPCPTELLQLDSTEDQAIRNMAAADYNNFQGVQEEFSGPLGPTFDHSGMFPLQVFQQIWETNVIDYYYNETNRYARQLFLKQKCNWTRLSRWKDVTSDEFWRFLPILMLQSVIVNNVERELRPLFGRGHTVVMDNFYNSPLLSRLLKSQHKTDTMGTLRLNREFVPEALKVKNKTTMKSGEVSFSSTKDLCVLVYMDNKNCTDVIDIPSSRSRRNRKIRLL